MTFVKLYLYDGRSVYVNREQVAAVFTGHGSESRRDLASILFPGYNGDERAIMDLDMTIGEALDALRGEA